MITDAQLRKAAEKSSDLYLRYIERDYNSTPSHESSASFEKKIRKLRKRADHPYFYKTLHKAAAVILAILISGSAWLAVDTEARAAFFGWVREIYETYFVYRFASNSDETSIISYRPTWLPDGYTELYYDNTDNTTFVAYLNDAGQMISFSYSSATDETSWFIDRNSTIVTRVEVDGMAADLFESTDSNNANAIIWSNADNTAFYISGFVSSGYLIRIAESVAHIQ